MIIWTKPNGKLQYFIWSSFGVFSPKLEEIKYLQLQTKMPQNKLIVKSFQWVTNNLIKKLCFAFIWIVLLVK